MLFATYAFYHNEGKEVNRMAAKKPAKKAAAKKPAAKKKAAPKKKK